MKRKRLTKRKLPPKRKLLRRKKPRPKRKLPPKRKLQHKRKKTKSKNFSQRTQVSARATTFAPTQQKLIVGLLQVVSAPPTPPTPPSPPSPPSPPTPPSPPSPPTPPTPPANQNSAICVATTLPIGPGSVGRASFIQKYCAASSIDRYMYIGTDILRSFAECLTSKWCLSAFSWFSQTKPKQNQTSQTKPKQTKPNGTECPTRVE